MECEKKCCMHSLFSVMVKIKKDFFCSARIQSLVGMVFATPKRKSATALLATREITVNPVRHHTYYHLSAQSKNCSISSVYN